MGEEHHRLMEAHVKTEKGMCVACGRNSKELSLCAASEAKERERVREGVGEGTEREREGGLKHNNGVRGERDVVHLQGKQFVAHTGFPGGSDGKEPACNGGDLCSIPGLGRSPGEGNGKLLQYSCVENPMDGGAW